MYAGRDGGDTTVGRNEAAACTVIHRTFLCPHYSRIFNYKLRSVEERTVQKTCIVWVRNFIMADPMW
jgi:hypothetical protein